MDRKAWLAWRHLGLGSSDAPIVMGVSRFKTALELWDEKILPFPKEDDSNSFIKNAGNEAEIKVRVLFEMLQETTYEPETCVMDDPALEFMRVSLDGRSPCKKDICEIKLLGNGGKGAKPEEQKFNRAKNEGIVPEEYFPQIQMQLLVSGAERCFFVAYEYDHNDKYLKNPMTETKLAVVEVFPDKDYQLKLLEKCIEFWNSVVSKKPPLLSSEDYMTIKDKEIKKLAAEYTRVCKKLDPLEARKKELRELLIANPAHSKMIIGKVKVQSEEKQGAVDKDKMYSDLENNFNIAFSNLSPEAKAGIEKTLIQINPEKYRKKSSTVWKLYEA